jgi:predicted PurR-regulated permease PerM
LEGSQVRKVAFLFLFLILFILVGRLFYPFMTILLWSGLIYLFLSPLYEKARLRRDGRERGKFATSVLAGIFAFGGILLIAVPAVILGGMMIRQLSDMAGSAMRAIERDPSILDLSPQSAIGGLIYRLSGGSVDLSAFSIKDELKRYLSERTGQIIGLSGALLKNAAEIVLTLAFMIFTLFFFLIDGRHLIGILVRAIPIEKHYTTMFLRKLRETGKQLLKGYFVVALIQSLIMLGLCAVFKVKGALVIAFLTAIASFIPMVGTSLVWLPVSAAKIAAGDTAGGILFFVLSASLIWSLDNFIRPILLREGLKIHPLLIFFAILGGLEIFGFNGLVLGPLILILFFAALELYERADPSRESVQDEGGQGKWVGWPFDRRGKKRPH